MKSFSPAGAAVKAFFGLGARTIGNPGGALTGDGSYNGGGGGGGGGLIWTSRGQIGGALHTLASVARSGTILITGGDTEVFRSLDHGTTWTSIHTLPFNLVNIAAGSANTVCVCGSVTGVNQGSLARSLDSGTTWADFTPFPNNTIGNQIGTDGTGHWVMLGGIAAQGQVFQSADNGANWSGPGAFTNRSWSNTNLLWVNSAALFVALGLQTGTGFPTINTSLDLGTTWVETVLDNTGLLSFAGLSFNSTLGLYILGLSSADQIRVSSTPAGLAIAPNISTGLTDGGCNAALGAGSLLYAFGFNGGVSNSTDGSTWTPGTLNFQPPGNNNEAFSALYDPLTPVTVAVGRDGNVATQP